LNPYSIFAWIEASALSAWIRESPSLWAFPFILILHTVGMGFLVGANIAIDLRVLGFAPRIPESLLAKFFGVIKVAFFINAISGILLLIGYPTKALTNPLFYVKLGLIAFAMSQTGRIVRTKGPVLAVMSLGAWAGAVAAGRFLAYTYVHLMAGE
jgi:hypothetical protein